MSFFTPTRWPSSPPPNPSTGPHRAVETGERRRPRLLIVDDNDDTRDVVAWCMRAAGWLVQDVTNGADALAAAAMFEPDVIVMDLALPVIDGITATKRLKADPCTAHVPVVAFTAFLREHFADVYDVRFDDVVQKPCPPETLRERLEALVRRGEPGWGPAAP